MKHVLTLAALALGLEQKSCFRPLLFVSTLGYARA
jgi:hypothetical protein